MVLEKTLESPLDCKEIQPVHPKGDQSWVFFGRTYAEAETLILWPPHVKSWLIGKDSNAGGIGGRRRRGRQGWDGWMASPTRWTWVWVNSRSWWWTGRPGVLQFMGSKRVGHDWATELNWVIAFITLINLASQNSWFFNLPTFSPELLLCHMRIWFMYMLSYLPLLSFGMLIFCIFLLIVFTNFSFPCAF